MEVRVMDYWIGAGSGLFVGNWVKVIWDLVN